MAKNDENDSDQLQHDLIPKHEVLSDDEKEELFDTLNIGIKELPKIKIDDPAIQHLDAETGDVVEITRNSPTAGKSTFYRGVVND